MFRKGTKSEAAFEVLKKSGKRGMTAEEISDVSGLTPTSVATTFVSDIRNKLGKDSINCIDGKYYFKYKLQTEQKSTMREDDLIKTIKSGGKDGLTMNEISKSLKTSLSCISSMICVLRKKHGKDSILTEKREAGTFYVWNDGISGSTLPQKRKSNDLNSAESFLGLGKNAFSKIPISVKPTINVLVEEVKRGLAAEKALKGLVELYI